MTIDFLKDEVQRVNKYQLLELESTDLKKTSCVPESDACPKSILVKWRWVV